MITAPRTFIIGIDPGLRPGYAATSGPLRVRKHFQASEVVAVAESWRGMLDQIAIGRKYRIAVEGQFSGRIYSKSDPVSAESIIKLAFSAGYQAAQATHADYCLGCYPLQPSEWKDALYREGGRTRKDVFCNRIRDALLPHEAAKIQALDLTPKREMDILDAIGLAWALALLPEPKPFARH
jgi:hypothetical protein